MKGRDRIEYPVPAFNYTVTGYGFSFPFEGVFPRDKWYAPPFHIPVSAGPLSCQNHGTQFVFQAGISGAAGSA